MEYNKLYIFSSFNYMVFSVLEKIKDILSDIKDKVSSLDLNSKESFERGSMGSTAEYISNQLDSIERELKNIKEEKIDSFKIDSIDTAANHISRQLGEVEDRLRDIKDKISDESGVTRRIPVLLESIESKLEDIKEAIIRRGGRGAGGEAI